MKEVTDRQLKNAIVKVVEERKAVEAVQIDLRKIKEAPTDWMFIIQATSTTHATALSDAVIDGLRKKFHLHPLSVAGEENAEWIAIDYGSIFVHVMLSHMRDYYRLEELWADGKIKKIEIEN